jgi:hypothetical protein
MATKAKKSTTKSGAAKKSGKKKTTAKKTATKKTSSKKTASKKVAKKNASTAKKTKQTSPKDISISAEERWRMIATTAYLKAEARNFEPGHETEDWFTAEKEVDALIGGKKAK